MATETVFYDGDCGLCHRSVRFLLGADREGRLFRFAPIEGETFRARVAPHLREALPDSLVVLAEDGRLLTRSAATVHVLRRVGGVWAVLAALVAAVPTGLRDAVYDVFARTRHRLFARPDGSCPVTSPPMRARFDP